MGMIFSLYIIQSCRLLLLGISTASNALQIFLSAVVGGQISYHIDDGIVAQIAVGEDVAVEAMASPGT